MASRSRPVVGMLQQNLFDIYADQSFGAMDAATELGCDLICFCGRPLEDTGFKRQANVVYDLVTPESVDCLVVWTSTLGIHVGDERLEEFCRRFAPMPIVAVEQGMGDAPMVLMDNRSGMRDAVDHLIEEHGHRRIAFARGPITHEGAEERYQGYLEAMRSHGLVVEDALVSANSDPWTSDGIAASDTVVMCGVTAVDDQGVATGHAAEIDADWLARIVADPPDAVAAVNDGFAVAIVAVLANAGIRVPEDVAVVGFDDSINITAHELGFGSSEDADPPVDSLALTTVRAPFYELGHRAVEVAARMVRGEPVDDVVTVPTELVVRTSCGCTPTRAQEVDAPAERDWHYMQVVVEKRSQTVREIGQDLIAASGMDELLDMLPGSLAKVGITTCSLAAYHGDLPVPSETTTPATVKRAKRTATAWSDLLFACQDGVGLEIGADAAMFRSAELTPGGLPDGPVPRNTVVAPLYFTDEQLGFVLLEVGPRIGWLYETIQSQLSAALHRAFMVERERAALAAVEQAHRREERQRLAGDLHDSVSQALFSMTLHTRALQLMVDRDDDRDDDRMARGLEDLRELTQTALSEMRALIFQLRPDALHADGLVVAIRKQAAALSARENVDILVDATQDHFPLDERAESELFLFVREAMHNSAKHARAGMIHVRLVEKDGSSLEIEVLDDGTGFDPQVRRPGHFGLDTMRERVEGLGGEFVIESSPATSTTVRAHLPDVLAVRR